MSYIELRDLQKIYIQGDEKIYALDHLTLNIEKGEYVAILGPSGSGKSTLLHTLGGLDTPTDGEVIVDNVDISSYTDTELAVYRRKTVGFVFLGISVVIGVSSGAYFMNKQINEIIEKL